MIDGDTRAVRGQPRSAAGPLAWILLAISLGGVLAYCASGEPVMGDGWGHHDWHRHNGLGLWAIVDYAWEIYQYENPRLGQLFTMLLYTPGPYHAITTPVVELLLFWLLAALALGRIPSVRRPDDALVVLILVAAIAVCTPQIGPMLFYRPFTGNYTLGLVLNLIWLLPYRLEISAARPPRVWLAPLCLVLGVLAGLCNEHTGIAFFAMGLAASLYAWRRLGRFRIWMLAGLVGLLAGYVVLLSAPGQSLRYEGLAERAGIVGRILERGISGNLRVLGLLAAAIAPLLPVVVLAVLDRRARTSAPPSPEPAHQLACLALALGGVVCTLTLLASPKLGGRLYLASVALISAGLAGWLAGQLHRARLRLAIAVLAGTAALLVAIRLVAIARVVGPLGRIRLERLAAGPPGSIVRVPPYPVEPSRYFLGEDFGDNRRQSLAVSYQLGGVELEP